jgi:hypothetical protein
VVSFTPQPLYRQKRAPAIHWLGGPQNQSGRSDNEKAPCCLWEHSPGRPEKSQTIYVMMMMMMMIIIIIIIIKLILILSLKSRAVIAQSV